MARYPRSCSAPDAGRRRTRRLAQAKAGVSVEGRASPPGPAVAQRCATSKSAGAVCGCCSPPRADPLHRWRHGRGDEHLRYSSSRCRSLRPCTCLAPPSTMHGVPAPGTSAGYVGDMTLDASTARCSRITATWSRRVAHGPVPGPARQPGHSGNGQVPVRPAGQLTRLAPLIGEVIIETRRDQLHARWRAAQRERRRRRRDRDRGAGGTGGADVTLTTARFPAGPSYRAVVRKSITSAIRITGSAPRPPIATASARRSSRPATNAFRVTARGAHPVSGSARSSRSPGPTWPASAGA